MTLKITTRERLLNVTLLRDTNLGDIFFLHEPNADWKDVPCMRIEGLEGEYKFVKLNDGTVHKMGPVRGLIMLSGELSVYPAQDDPA